MNSSVRIPLVFVFLWSSTFIAFEFCAAYAEPATFIVLRTAITAVLLFIIVIFVKSNWPKHPTDVVYSAIVGILIHGIYAGGSFASIYYGVDVGICAIILSLQPLLTVLLSSTFLGETISIKKIVGILAGFLGVSTLILDGDINTAQVLLEPGISTDRTGNGFALSMCFAALFAISIGVIVQKRHCGNIELLPGACIQYSAAAFFMLPLALTLETMQINWNLSFIIGLSWLIIVISLGAMSLFMILIKRGDAGTVSSLFYLVTPLVALQAWIFFDDQFSLISLIGMLLCMLSVIAVNHAPSVKPRVTVSG